MFQSSSYLTLPDLLWKKTPPEQLFLFENQNRHSIINKSHQNYQNNETLINSFQEYGQAQKPSEHSFTMAYSGHQFGHFAGVLGDGRAINLGVYNGLEYQLKGSGITEFSRGGDGLAVLRSSIREYLGMCYMKKLGIPTTEAVMITSFPDIKVHREEQESSAIVMRSSTSFARFGHIEYLTYFSKPSEHIQNLTCFVDYLLPLLSKLEKEQNNTNLISKTINENHETNTNKNPLNKIPPVQQLWFHVIKTHAQLLAYWQSYGFCHGVLNTDNMSLLGLTLDYGPFAFLQNYNPDFICNHSDHQGRYRYSAQPEVFRYNFVKLWQSLMPLLKSQLTDEQAQECVALYEQFDDLYQSHFFTLSLQRLGFNINFTNINDDEIYHTIYTELMQLIEQSNTEKSQITSINQIDITLIYQDFMKILDYVQKANNTNNIYKQIIDTNQIEISRKIHHQWIMQNPLWLQWLKQWLQLQPSLSIMEQKNPNFCLRNGFLQDFIMQAQNEGLHVLTQAEDYIEQLFVHQHHQPYESYQLPTSEVILSCSS
jgi:uncharacterized protein YdiU (UPF0061 family)